MPVRNLMLGLDIHGVNYSGASDKLRILLDGWHKYASLS